MEEDLSTVEHLVEEDPGLPVVGARNHFGKQGASAGESRLFFQQVVAAHQHSLRDAHVSRLVKAVEDACKGCTVRLEQLYFSKTPLVVGVKTLLDCTRLCGAWPWLVTDAGTDLPQVVIGSSPKCP